MRRERVAQMIADGEITVVRSARRRKTYALSRTDSGWKLAVPARFDVAAHAADIAALLERAERRLARAVPSDAELAALALELSQRYFDDGLVPRSVRWSERQRHRFASASGQTWDIRVSTRLREVPRWVLEAVLVHELAHLRHMDHSPQFHALADRHPRQAEAAVFLEGFACGERSAGCAH